jgi:hypothetical protein
VPSATTHNAKPLVPAEPVSERAPIVPRPADATFLNNLVEIGWAETSAEESRTT